MNTDGKSHELSAAAHACFDYSLTVPVGKFQILALVAEQAD
jgi:hypothetical protein